VEGEVEEVREEEALTARVVVVPERDEWVERLKKELNEYEVGGYDLDQVFEPLLQACSKVAKTYSEFKEGVSESVSTLKSAMNKVRY